MCVHVYEFLCVCRIASYSDSPDFMLCSSVTLFLHVCVYTSALCVKHSRESVSAHACVCDCVFAAITVCPYMRLHSDAACLPFLCVRMRLCMHVFTLGPDV